MQQHPGVCSSITPQFSCSWKPHFTALITGLLSNHYHKKVQEAEEFAFLSPFKSSSLCFKSSNKTALTKTLNSFMCLQIHICTHRDPLHFYCPAYQRKCKEANLSKHMGCIWPGLSEGLCSGDSAGRQRKDCPKCSFWPNSSTYII